MGKLVASPLSTVADLSFDDDLLGRREFGERLLGLIESAPSGAVLALNAPWGEGKTTFVKMWTKLLQNKGAATVYLDAFEQDHIDDPFLPLVASLLEFAKEQKAKNPALKTVIDNVRTNAGRVGAKFAGWAAKNAVKAATLNVLKDADIEELKKLIVNGTANAAEAAIEAQIEKFTSDKQAVKAFRDDLEALAKSIVADSGFPLVFIIDELDRCRPTFAVTLVERIKHVLDVPGIVFVFVLNRPQLEEAVKCVYGQGIDASGYLAKFVHLWCSLPKRGQSQHDSDYQKYCNALYEAHELKAWDDENDLRHAMAWFSQQFGLSLREMERLFTNIAVFYATAKENQLRLPDLAVALAIIRIRYPEIYNALREKRITYDQFKQAVPEFQRKPENDTITAYVRAVFMYCLMSDSELIALGKDSKVLRFKEWLTRRHFRSRDSIVPRICSFFDMFQTE